MTPGAALATQGAGAVAPAQELPRPIQRMLSDGKGVRFIATFDAGSGLTGYVLGAATGERRIFYVTSDGTKAILGLVFNEKLENLTAGHQKEHIDVSEYLKPPRLASQDAEGARHPAEIGLGLSSLAMAVEGDGLPVYVFVDPASKELAHLHRATREHLGSLKIYWLPAVAGEAAPVAAKLAALVAGDAAPAKALARLAAAGGSLKGEPEKAAVARMAAAINEAALMLRVQRLKAPLVALHDASNARRLLVGAPSQADWTRLAADGRKVIGARRGKANAAAGGAISRE